ncbi:hypothetical protein [Ensifer adhaerens]|uniref:hypothetical protein n=1 Tax=Ensifer adhaerens TaxID=106592 RepID=UPI0015C391FE|nr:hypothetical protein [Ensifer adhaerens]
MSGALKKFEDRMWALIGVGDQGPGWRWHITEDRHPQLHRMYARLVAANDNQVAA